MKNLTAGSKFALLSSLLLLVGVCLFLMVRNWAASPQDHLAPEEKAASSPASLVDQHRPRRHNPLSDSNSAASESGSRQFCMRVLEHNPRTHKSAAKFVPLSFLRLALEYTGKVLEVQSDEEGKVVFSLPPGIQSLSVAAEGFKPGLMEIAARTSQESPVDLGDLVLEWSSRLNIHVRGPEGVAAYEIYVAVKTGRKVTTPFGNLEYDSSLRSFEVKPGKDGTAAMGLSVPPRCPLKVVVVSQAAPGASYLSRCEKLPALGQGFRTVEVNFLSDTVEVCLESVLGDSPAGRHLYMNNFAKGDKNTFSFGTTDADGRCVFENADGHVSFFLTTADGRCEVKLVSVSSGAGGFQHPRGQLFLRPDQDMVGILLKDQDGARVTRFFMGFRPSSSKPTEKDKGIALATAEALERHDTLWFKTENSPFFPVDIAELRANREGGFLVATVPGNPGEIAVRTSEGSTLQVEVSRAGRTVLTASPMGDEKGTTWMLTGLAPGQYELAWYTKKNWRSFRRQFTSLVLKPGENRTIAADPPDRQATEVIIENWDLIPARHRPRRLWNEGNSSETINGPSFTCTLASPLGGDVILYPSQARVSWKDLMAHFLKDGRLSLRIPLSWLKDTAIAVHPRHEGWRLVAHRSQILGKVPDLLLTPSSYDVHWEDDTGLLHIHFMQQESMSRAVLEFRETRNNINRVLGLVMMAELSRWPSSREMELPGREVVLQYPKASAQPSVLLVFATPYGEVSVATGSYPARDGSLRFWLPDAAVSVNVVWRGEFKTVRNSAIQKVLVTGE